MRGRGRPPKDEPTYFWSQVPRGTKVQVADERGEWKFGWVADNGTALTVIGGPFGHYRTLPVSKISVRLQDLLDQISPSSSSDT